MYQKLFAAEKSASTPLSDSSTQHMWELGTVGWEPFHRRKMSTHALPKMTRDRFRVMSLAPRRKCPRNVVQMREAMAALLGNDRVAISCHCKRSKIILVKVLTEVCSLENIAS